MTEFEKQSMARVMEQHEIDNEFEEKQDGIGKRLAIVAKGCVRIAARLSLNSISR